MSSTPLSTTRTEPAVKRLLPPDSSSGAASSISTDAPCSCAASAAQKAALPAPTTMTSAALSTITNPLLFPERRAGTATLAQRMARLSAALKVVRERPCNAASEGRRPVPASVRLRSRNPDDLAKALDLGPHELIEFLRRRVVDVGAGGLQVLAIVGIGSYPRERLFQHVDHLGRRVRRREHAVPCRHDEIGDFSLGHGGHLRRPARARGAGRAQDPHSSSIDLRDERLVGIK